MGTTTVEATITKPVVDQATATTPWQRVEMRVDSQPESWTEVVVREVMVEDAAPLCSAPMSETGCESWRPRVVRRRADRPSHRVSEHGVMAPHRAMGQGILRVLNIDEALILHRTCREILEEDRALDGVW
jgi:hypothetical protein